MPPTATAQQTAAEKKAAAAANAAAKKAADAAARAAKAAAKAAARADAKANKGPAAGKGPGGKPWVDWIKEQAAKGKSRKDIQDAYVELRSGEATYKGRTDVLKRHAYRHVRLALGEGK